MPDLHAWITRQIDAVEAAAHDATNEPWAANQPDGAHNWTIGIVPHNPRVGIAHLMARAHAAADARHIAAHCPATVLRRCEADRRILARHRLNPNAYWAEAAMCDGCGTEGEMGYPRTENLNDCPELLDLGYAHGLTAEILAVLDRPQEGERPKQPAGPKTELTALVEAYSEALTEMVMNARPLEPRPEVKALEILDPHLKKIPGYIPTSEEQP